MACVFACSASRIFTAVQAITSPVSAWKRWTAFSGEKADASTATSRQTWLRTAQRTPLTLSVDAVQNVSKDLTAMT